MLLFDWRRGRLRLPLSEAATKTASPAKLTSRSDLYGDKKTTASGGAQATSRFAATPADRARPVERRDCALQREDTERSGRSARKRQREEPTGRVGARSLRARRLQIHHAE